MLDAAQEALPSSHREDPRNPSRTIDLLDGATHNPDPWETYRWMRRHCPMYFDQANELWGVACYDDVVTVSMDPDTFTSTEGNRPGIPADASLIHLDGHPHSLRRKLVSPRFTPRAVMRLEPWLRRAVTSLLDGFCERGEADFVADLARPLPAMLIGHMLGHPPEDREQVLAWVEVFTRAGQGPAFLTEEVNDAYAAFANYHFGLVEQRLGTLGEDLLSTWLTAEVDGQTLDEEAILFDHTLLLVGGAETTRNVIAGGLHVLSDNPEQLAWLQAHPEGLPNAIEEIIRWVTPFVSMARTATRDVKLGRAEIRAGEQIKLLYPSANRDERYFTDPDRFDVRRTFTHRPLSFGYGAHFCLGASLARLELSVVFEEVLRRMPDVRVAPGATPAMDPNSFLRSYPTMPVVFTPTAREGGSR